MFETLYFTRFAVRIKFAFSPR